MDRTFWLDLVAIGTLVWLGYIGARFAGRIRLPAVTGFLIVGIVLGPHGTGFLSEELLHRIGFAEPLALGLIVFVIGEELTRRALARHHWSFWLTSALNIGLPLILVGWAVSYLVPDAPQVAWLLGTIAIAGAPATVMAVINETKARGRACDTLLGSAALDNIACVVLYSIVVPYLLWTMNVHTTVSAAAWEVFKEIGGAAALGVVSGVLVAKILEKVHESGEILALGLTNVLLVVAVAQAIGVSPVLAPLVAGITVATVEERRNSRERIFKALRTVEYPTYIIFFTLAGAELEVSAVMLGGFLMVGYIVARSIGKFAAGFGGSLAGGYSARDSAWLGLGMLPQAGVAVGLALNVGQVFPEIGPTINAVVLASLVFFEVFGPVMTRRAVDTFGDSVLADEEYDGPLVCRDRAVVVPVGGMLAPERLTRLFEAAQTELEDDCPTRFILTHVVNLGRPSASTATVGRGQALLENLAQKAGEQGYRVETRLVRARTVEGGVADLVNEIAAELVVVSFSRPGTGLVGRSPLRRRTHRLLDWLDVPVLVVPDDGEA